MAGIKSYSRKVKLPMFTIIDEINYKLCSKCNSYKSYEKFSKSSINNSGLKSQCKDCCSVTNGDANYYKNKHYNSNGLLKCFKCNQYKNENLFYVDINNSIRNNRHRICKECESVRKQQSRITTNPKSDLQLLLKNLLKGCKSRTLGKTKKGSCRNKSFNIDMEYLNSLFIKQDGRCAISGILMTYYVGYGKQKFNVSIDRLNCNKGYTKDNIQLVCAHINIMRGNLDIQELIDICTIIHNNYNK